MKPSRTLLLSAVLVAATGFPVAQAADISVNGQTLKPALVDFVLKEAGHGQKLDDAMRDNVINQLIKSELVYQDALKQGLAKQPDVALRAELAQRDVIINAYVENYMKKNPVSDDAIKAEYDKLKQQMGDKEYQARHILVKTEQEAKDIIAGLNKGGDFAKVAKEKSLDPGSKERGGELGWFSPAGMVKPFGDAVAKLKKGAYTITPIQTQYGWHVIQLEDTRAAQPPALDKVQDNIQRQIQQRSIEKMLADLTSKAKIVGAPSGKK